MPGRGRVPDPALQRVETVHLHRPKNFDVLGLHGLQGLLHDPVHGPPVGVPELIGDLLVGAALGGQLHGAGLAPLRQGPVVATPARRSRR